MRKSRNRVLGLTAALTAGTLVLAGCGAGGGAERTTEDGLQVVTVAYTPVFSVGAIQLGMDQGFFEDEGLEIKLKQVANPPAGIASVAGKQVDFNYTPSIPLANAIASGVKLDIVAAADGYAEGTVAAVETDPAAGLKHDDTALVVDADASIDSPADLEGHTVSVPARNAQMEVTIAAAVEADGGDPTKIEWITLDFPSAVSSLESGRVDAAGLVVPFTTQAVNKGAKNINSPGVGFFGDGAVGVWVASPQLAASDPEIVEKFQRAINATNAYANEHVSDAQQAAATVLEVDVATVRSGATPYFPTEVDPADLETVVTKMVELGYLDTAVDLGALVVEAP